MTSSSPEVSRRMARVRQKGTQAELDLRRALFARGLRYRLQMRILVKTRRVADIVFPRIRVAVFVDGCFWHGCPLHATWPKTNSAFWRTKIETNRVRDTNTDSRMRESDWEVIRVWTHEPVNEAADRIARVVEERKHRFFKLSTSERVSTICPKLRAAAR
jgi:DNA mismatch endonuclease, patch repair protein